MNSDLVRVYVLQIKDTVYPIIQKFIFCGLNNDLYFVSFFFNYLISRIIPLLDLLKKIVVFLRRFFVNLSFFQT